MELIGYYDSPFVRRVAITAQFLGIEYKHRELSIFRDYDEFREIQPLVKVPTLICDDGTMLVDSNLIISYLESLASENILLMPDDPSQQRQALKHLGTSIVAMEKGAQLVYEMSQRPKDKQHPPWRLRLEEQLASALAGMETAVSGVPQWLFGERISQADISIAVAWQFAARVAPDTMELSQYLALPEYSARAEALPEFQACGDSS